MKGRLIELLNELLSWSMICPSFYFYDPTSFPFIKGFVLSLFMVSRGEDTRLYSRMRRKLVVICAPIGLGLIKSTFLFTMGLGFGSSSSGSTLLTRLTRAASCGLSSPDVVVSQNR